MSSATLLTIAGSRLSASVSTLGAELQTLADADGRDLLWDGDPAFWTGRAPLLFPIVGRLAGDSYRLDGRTYRLPQHGFARRRAFTVVRTEPDAVTLRLEADDETRAAYPFAFRLDVTFAVAGDRLDMAAVLSNPGDTPLPASFGYHPAFRWPLPYGRPRDAHEIVFERDETAPIHRPDADSLRSAESQPSPVDGRRLALSDALFADGALVFTSLASRRLVYGAPGAPRLAIDFPDTPHLGIWTKPGAGAPYVCVEPWQGHADPAGFVGEIWEKPGIAVLAPGETRRWRMEVERVD
ncbi:MAG TPA: aldose 1-epimerase family protein [Methylomirabilota bacterium]|nr:aldose 1-epimerase family protein [Methylomirabilota bacterium]